MRLYTSTKTLHFQLNKLEKFYARRDRIALLIRHIHPTLKLNKTYYFTRHNNRIFKIK